MRSHDGYCPICEENTTFVIEDDWLRDNYFCIKCRSIPRYRAIWKMIQLNCPNLSEMTAHESSPGGPVSNKLAQICGNNITFSNIYKDMRYGETREDGMRCENLECLSDEDETYNLYITQDVMEHVYNPIKAFQEIERVLKQGGMHIFTVPLTGGKKTVKRVDFKDGKMIHLLPPIYHANPIDPEGGALVISDWGYDICDFIEEHTNMNASLHLVENKQYGLRGEYLEVIIARKGDDTIGEHTINTE